MSVTCCGYDAAKRCGEGGVYGIVERGGMYRVQWRIVVCTEKTFERLALAAQARALRGKDVA
jgi:hypothetical protein